MASSARQTDIERLVKTLVIEMEPTPQIERNLIIEIQAFSLDS